MNFSQEINKGLNYLAGNDIIIKSLIEKYPKFNLKPHTNYFDDLVASIIMQQLSMKAGTSILNKFKNHFKVLQPDIIYNERDNNLRNLGISYQKIKYIKDLCENIINGNIDLNDIAKLSNEDIVKILTKVKGIGVWTVQMFLIFTLCRLDVLPDKDLGIRKAVGNLYLQKDIATDKEVREIALLNKWNPYETLASWYLWRSLENT